MSDTPNPSELAEEMAGTEAENEPGSSDDDDQLAEEMAGTEAENEPGSSDDDDQPAEDDDR